MDYFSKQREKLVCNACPKSYALASQLRMVHSIVRTDTASTTATANTTAKELSLSRQLQEYLDSTKQPYRQPQDTYLWHPEKKPLGYRKSTVLCWSYLLSVEAEWVFSASGLYLTKLRCRLSDNSIDMLVFLKFYFGL